MKRVDLLVALKATRAKGEKVQLPIGPILVMLAALGGLAYYALVMVKGTDEELVKKRQTLAEIKTDITDLQKRNEFFKQVGPFYENQANSIRAEIKNIVDANITEESKSQGLPLRLFTTKLEKILSELCRPNEDGTIPEKLDQQLISYERTGDQIVLRGLTKDYDFPAKLAQRLADLQDESFRQEPVWEESNVKEINPIPFSNDKIQREVDQFKAGAPETSKTQTDKQPGDAKKSALTPSSAKTESGKDKSPMDKPSDANPDKDEKEPGNPSADKDARLPFASHSVAQEIIGGVSAVPGPAFRIGSVVRVYTKAAQWKLTPLTVYEFEIRMEATEVK